MQNVSVHQMRKGQLLKESSGHRCIFRGHQGVWKDELRGDGAGGKRQEAAPGRCHRAPALEIREGDAEVGWF